MKAEDLWIGDRVRLLKSYRVGTYEGEDKNGKARVQVNGRIVRTTFSNLTIEPEEKSSTPISFENTIQKAHKPKWGSEIDLHMERMYPDIPNALPEHVLIKQLSACKSFLDNSVAYGPNEVKIIHGIGAGRLRSEVHHLLDGYEEVTGYTLVNNGGATVVRLKS